MQGNLTNCVTVLTDCIGINEQVLHVARSLVAGPAFCLYVKPCGPPDVPLSPTASGSLLKFVNSYYVLVEVFAF